MQARITRELLIDPLSQPRSRPFEISDDRLSGFILRVQPSGVRCYCTRFGRNRRLSLGTVENVSPEEARQKCQMIIGNLAQGRHPLEGLHGTAGFTLGHFIKDAHTPWVLASRPKTAANTLEKLNRLFGTWYSEPLTAITVERLEFWKSRRLRAGSRPTTLLRDLFTLSSVLRRAVRMGMIKSNPIRLVDKPRIDRGPKVRYLDADEESRLRPALETRDWELRHRRESINRNRHLRGQELLPSLPRFGDHLTPRSCCP